MDDLQIANALAWATAMVELSCAGEPNWEHHEINPFDPTAWMQYLEIFDKDPITMGPQFFAGVHVALALPRAEGLIAALEDYKRRLNG